MLNNKACELMAKVFNVSVDLISEQTSIDSLEEWDSVNHMNLVMALEEEFGLTLTDEEMVTITSAKLVCEAVDNNG
ncbi:MAG: acyl carrier protein [Planctomycetota bacterium]|jgi:acyl carrier protein